ncbi:MAG: DivIVA domain-containing protein [Proteobacteria bacterium]|nr:DivIVA domain-containing protein [Pseudomonadota bacterium]
MKMTPLDIQQQKFKIRFRGFDVQEVDGFLEEVASVMESIITENDDLKEKFRKLDLENKTLKKQEDSFKKVMLSSQKVIEQMKENTKKSGELIIADAEVKAEKILNGAHNRLAQLHEDISELKRQRMQIVVHIRSIIESHTKLLELSNEEAKTSDAADSKVQILKTR